MTTTNGIKHERSARRIIQQTLGENDGYTVSAQYTLQPHQLSEKPLFSDSIIVDIFVQGMRLPGIDSFNGLVVSVKSQDVGGTAEQKVYYEVDYVLNTCCSIPSILILVGDWWTSGKRNRFIEWANAQRTSGRLSFVFVGFDDFFSFLSKYTDIDGPTTLPSKIKSFINGAGEVIITEQRRML